MKLVVIAAVASTFALGAAAAQAQEALAQSSGCLTCHAAATKKVGPSFKDIGAKHDAKDASALAAKLKDGKGHTKISASDAEITTMVQYVLSQK